MAFGQSGSMNNRYIKNQSLQQIQKRYNNSSQWKQILKKKKKINRCLDCNINGQIIWKGKRTTTTHTNIIDIIRPRKPKDELATGIGREKDEFSTVVSSLGPLANI